MPDAPQFLRRSVVAACNMLANHPALYSHARFNGMLLEWGVEEAVGNGSLQDKANDLIRYIDAGPDVRTADGEFLADAVVRKAASLPYSHGEKLFVRALARDGFTLTEVGELRRTLPEVADLPQADDEVHALLDELGMATAKGHLDLAIDNHARGQWAPANGELRKVVENMFDEIAERLNPDRAAATPKGNARRQLLADLDPPFLQELLGEWSSGPEQGKNFVNGVFKRLHREGGHPGLSDAEDCTFRLHLVLILARLFLRRAKSLIAAL